MSKYTGELLMDDTGLKEHTILSEKVRVQCERVLGPGQFTSNISVDNRRLLKWAYVTDNDETPATETVVIDPNLIGDPATAEIAEHREQNESDLADIREERENAEDEKQDDVAHLGSSAEQDLHHRAKN